MLLCAELVLDDLEVLLLVGRLLRPVKGMTGGSTAAGGTCAAAERRAVQSLQFTQQLHGGFTHASYLAELCEEAVDFLLLSAVQGLNFTHVSEGECEKKMKKKKQKEIQPMEKGSFFE